MTLPTIYPPKPLLIPLEPLTQSSFAPFGTVNTIPRSRRTDTSASALYQPAQGTTQPSPPSPSHRPSQSKPMLNQETIPNPIPQPLQPHETMPVYANQSTALKTSPLSPFLGDYPGRPPSRPIVSLFSCYPRLWSTLVEPSNSEINSTSSSDAEIGSARGPNPTLRLKLNILERHPYTTQTFIPVELLAEDRERCFIVIVAPSLPNTSTALTGEERGGPEATPYKPFDATNTPASGLDATTADGKAPHNAPAAITSPLQNASPPPATGTEPTPYKPFESAEAPSATTSATPSSSQHAQAPTHNSPSQITSPLENTDASQTTIATTTKPSGPTPYKAFDSAGHANLDSAAHAAPVSKPTTQIQTSPVSPLERPPDLSRLRAFLASGEQVTTYAPGTWHAPMVVLGMRRVDFIVGQFVNGVARDDCQEVLVGDTDTSGGGDGAGDGGAKVQIDLSLAVERMGWEEILRDLHGDSAGAGTDDGEGEGEGEGDGKRDEGLARAGSDGDGDGDEYIPIGSKLGRRRAEREERKGKAKL